MGFDGIALKNNTLNEHSQVFHYLWKNTSSTGILLSSLVRNSLLLTAKRKKELIYLKLKWLLFF